jgi:hypothetical protein
MGKLQFEVILDSKQDGEPQQTQSLKSYLSQMQQKNVYGGRDNTLKLLLNMIDQCQDKPISIRDNSTKSEQNGGTDQVNTNQTEVLHEEHKLTTAFTLLASVLVSNEEVLATFNKMNGLN